MFGQNAPPAPKKDLFGRGARGAGREFFQKPFLLGQRGKEIQKKVGFFFFYREITKKKKKRKKRCRTPRRAAPVAAALRAPAPVFVLCLGEGMKGRGYFFVFSQNLAPGCGEWAGERGRKRRGGRRLEFVRGGVLSLLKEKNLKGGRLFQEKFLGESGGKKKKQQIFLWGGGGAFFFFLVY